MKASLTGYFLTYRCVYLLDSACKGCSYNSSNLLYFFHMLLKSDLFYFVLVAKAYGFCLQAQPVNSNHILNVLETVKFVLCLQIHALAECTMNSKFCILHKATGAINKNACTFRIYDIIQDRTPSSWAHVVVA